MSRILTKQQRLQGLAALGTAMRQPDAELQHLIQTAHHHNAWFTPEYTLQAVTAMGEMLQEADLTTWFSQWPEYEVEPKQVGLILAGNIPLVGLHDIICVLAAGHIALIKQSSQDQKLIPALLKKLVEAEPGFAGLIRYIDRLEGYDAVIATGSNNSSRYFEYYFSKVPHIIRKNRNSVAVLTGNETVEQLKALGKDIFDYFGLGCRNISKMYVPEGYDFGTFFQAIEEFNSLADHHKYFHNYEYNKSIFLVNSDKHYDNGFILVKKDQRLASPLAVLFYEEYQDLPTVAAEVEALSEAIQCTIAATPITGETLPFGSAQHPRLWDYADGINTMNFLNSLK